MGNNIKNKNINFKMAWQMYVARFLDLGFVVGFATLAIVYPILAIEAEQWGLDSIIVEGYYVFFALFFLATFLKMGIIHEYCAFVNSLWIKSLFYIFCASLAFAQFDLWICPVVGSCMAVGAILNMIRCCGGQDDINAGSSNKK